MNVYRSIAIPTANKPPIPKASAALTADALEEPVDLVLEAVAVLLELLELLPLLLLLPLLMEPSVPLEVAVPGRLTVAFAARAI